jgi:hypothetical protein
MKNRGMNRGLRGGVTDHLKKELMKETAPIMPQKVLAQARKSFPGNLRHAPK